MNTDLRLKAERMNREWTQSDVANKLGVKKQTVCDWEKGRKFPRRQTLDALENLFNLSHRQLFAPVTDDDSFSSIQQ